MTRQYRRSSVSNCQDRQAVGTYFLGQAFSHLRGMSGFHCFDYVLPDGIIGEMESMTARCRGQDNTRAFSERVDEWRKYADTPLGRMRFELVTAHLLDYLGSRVELNVLDAGSGSGEYAAALALQGHRVFLLDSAAGMLSMAKLRLAQCDASLLDRAEFCCCPVEEVAQRFPAGHFDAVLAHTLLEYLGDPWLALTRLVSVLAADGILSLLLVNPYSEPFRAAWTKKDPHQAREALTGASSQADLFGLDRRVLPLTKVHEALRNSGIRVLAEYGIRIFSDYVDPGEIVQADFFQALKELELAAGALDPYRHVSRYTHVLGVKAA